jgi:hypothetical protein
VNKIVIENERDYLDYIKIIKSFSKNESVNDLKRHKAILNTNQDVIGVAMANGEEHIKQAADIIADDCNDFGAAKILEQIIEEQRR